MTKKKDFCFTWYVGDWMGGTKLMTLEMKGAYHELLMSQACNGHLSLDDIEVVLNKEGGLFDKYWKNCKKIRDKFVVDEDGNYFNEKLEKEITKRHKYLESRTSNLKSEQPEQLDSKKEKKINYSEKVKLTESQYNNLLEKYYGGNAMLLQEGIEMLDAYISQKGKDPYKRHEPVLRGWVLRNLKPNKQKALEGYF